MFLGSGDIQLGVNETLEDSAKVIGSMVDGMFARVGKHEEVAVGLAFGGPPLPTTFWRIQPVAVAIEGRI